MEIGLFLEAHLQSCDEHTARTEEGVFADAGVWAAIDTVEDVVDADGRTRINKALGKIPED